MKNKAILEHPALLRKGIFSLREASQVTGLSTEKLGAALAYSVRRGKLIRIKKGLFCILPAGIPDSQKGYPFNGYLIVKALAGKIPYFISHYSAMHLHGMTGESIQTIFISTAKQLRLPPGIRISARFLTCPEKRIWGLEEKWVTHEEKIWVSDLERTLLDILDRPDLSGGMMEIVRGLWLIRTALKLPKLMKYARRYDSAAVLKRLGFLMEFLSLGKKEEIERIQKWVQASPSYALLDPTLEPAGSYKHAWRLRLNCDPGKFKQNLMT